MANRSYLYAIDGIPDGKGRHIPTGLSEYSSDVPLVHKLMIANAPRRVPSVIWEADVGIVADRAGAAERVIAFAEKLLEGKVSDRGALTAELAACKAVLAGTPPGKYILLEIGEILETQEGDPLKAVDRLIKDLPALAAKVDRAIAGKEDKWLAALRKAPIDEFSFGAWSDVLYYSFDADDDDHEHGPDCDHDDHDVEAEVKVAKKKPAPKKKPAAKKKPAPKKKPAVKKKPAPKKKPR
jgi:hypothetical protein